MAPSLPRAPESLPPRVSEVSLGLPEPSICRQGAGGKETYKAPSTALAWDLRSHRALSCASCAPGIFSGVSSFRLLVYITWDSQSSDRNRGTVATTSSRRPCCVLSVLRSSPLFVGGLDWSTTQETLRSYFSQYGEVVDCVIMKDKTTNQSRGFGFVKFKDPNCVGTVLASRPHTLDGRNIDPKPCTPRGMQPERTRPKEGWQKGPRSDNSKSNKIFVGGIPHNCGETELREYFKKFGVVTEVVMIYDAEKQRPRGFGFITFEDEQSVDQAVNMHFHDIMGKKGASSGHRKGWVGLSPLPPAGAGSAGLVPLVEVGGMWVPAGQAIGFGYGPPPPPPDQFAPPGVPPPPATPGAAPLAFPPPPSQAAPDMSKPPSAQPDFPYSQYGYGQDLAGFGQGFSDPSQQPPSYGGPSVPGSGGPPAGGSGFGRGQNHNVQGFHPYRR
ncbi:hypothetical protein E2I00_006606 [Balaenoptera physalus]|uniref:DAZ-associated protein 1 n=1 Tax=Balaenoptera physalus TaxID=9770 RepID=A0A643BSS0_BALPH|nr:hypothetical protein E2I00_006606 [Balaenoptera physalus]